MPFTVSDFQDLVRLLRERPEWQAELRRLVLTDELLTLPQIVRELAEAQRRTEQRVDELARVQAQMLVEMADLRRDVGHLKGDNLERRYRERAGAYFDDLIRRTRVLSTETLADLLDKAVEQGQLAPTERKDILAADLVVQGRWQDDGEEVYLVVEVSVGIGLEDVVRAARRARALRKVRPALPVVAGEWMTPEAEAEATEQRVTCVLDGRALSR